MLTKKTKLSLLWIIAISLLSITYITNLFIPLTSDAGKYAAISRNIVESNDWINLTIHNEPYAHKPQFLFWLTALFFKIFGIHPSMLKLPVILFSILGFYSIYKLGELLYEKKIGLLACIMAFSSEIFLLFTNDIHMDILMAGACSFSLWMFVSYFKTKKFSHFILGLIGAGFSVFAKGIVGLSVPVFAIATHLVFTKQYKELFHPRWLWGIPIIGLFLLPTIIGIYNQIGWEGLHFYFIDNNIGRITGKLKGSNHDFLFYFHTTLYILLPWSFAVLISLFTDITENIKKGIKDTKNREFITLGGIIWYWIIISCAASKAPHFMLIITPLLFIITSKWIIKIFENKNYPILKKWLFNLQIIVWISLFVISLIASLWIFPTNNFWYWLFMAVGIILFFIGLTIKSKLSRFVLNSVIAISIISGTINMVVLPAEFSYHSTIPACKIFNKRANHNDILHSYNSEHRELFFYAKNPGLYLRNIDDFKNFPQKLGNWIYTDEKGYNEIIKSGYKITQKYQFKHKSMGNQSPKFLNPSTRKTTLKNMYLIKINY